MSSSTEITELLVSWRNGDKDAPDKLFPVVEKELHRLAHHYIRSIKPGNTLQTTVLINEAYLRLIDQKDVQWQNRAHFFGIAARMMRRFLLNYIRDQKRLKRGGSAIHVSLSEAVVVSNEKSAQLIALDDALNRLAQQDKRKSLVVELKYFGGLSVAEMAEVLNISEITVMRDWNMAKAWLVREIRSGK
jgi:RNA polymerase sigma-70 factor (ECF subfamily)